MIKQIILLITILTINSQFNFHMDQSTGAKGVFLSSSFRDLGQGFFPENDLYIEDDFFSFAAGGLSQSEFDQILDHVAQVYAPIVANEGGRLVINKLWSNGEVNARAYRQGATYFVDMYGGLARHSAMTAEGLYIVACHELGHHLGGAPLYTDNGNTWASTEGQSDYFSSAKCLRKVFAGQQNQLSSVDPIVKSACETQWTETADAEICMRSSMGGYATAKMFYEVRPGNRAPAFDQPDPRVVDRIFESHPPYQCRLDTYFQGALCGVSENENFSSSDPEVGACTRKQGHEVGLRPLCWYKPGREGGNPGGSVAASPLLNGSGRLRIRNPRQSIIVNYDVSEFPGADGVYIEVTQPNQTFSNPNGNTPDPRALGGVAQAGVRGGLSIVPVRDLPDWGIYQIRVVPLGQGGQVAVGNFSNPAILALNP